MYRYAIRATPDVHGLEDIVRVYEGEVLTPWVALQRFVEDVKETHRGWDVVRSLDVRVERVT